jgi:hypothetical protein
LSLFEFIVGMISVILALAIAQLFIGIADLLQNRNRVRFFLPHTLWNINLFLLTFVHWWSLWTFRDLSWNFAMFFYSLLGPSLIFFAATIVNPRNISRESIDLQEHYFSSRQLFLIVMILTVIAITLDGPLFGTEPPLNLLRATQVALVGFAAWGLVTENRRIHLAISLAVLGVVTSVTIIRFLPGQG